MVSVLASHVKDRKFVSLSDQSKDFIIGFCRFSSKHAALTSLSKMLLVQSQDNELQCLLTDYGISEETLQIQLRVCSSTTSDTTI